MFGSTRSFDTGAGAMKQFLITEDVLSLIEASLKQAVKFANHTGTGEWQHTAILAHQAIQKLKNIATSNSEVTSLQAVAIVKDHLFNGNLDPIPRMVWIANEHGFHPAVPVGTLLHVVVHKQPNIIQAGTDNAERH